MEEKSGINCRVLESGKESGKVILYYLPTSVESGNAPRLLVGIFDQQATMSIDGKAYCESLSK